MRHRLHRTGAVSIALASALAAAVPAHALELTRIEEQPLRLDVTATTLGIWHVDNRNRFPYDDNYGELTNRINLNLGWGPLLGGLRIDTATYFNVPQADVLARQHADPEDPLSYFDLRDQFAERLLVRYQDSYYLGKGFLTYSTPKLELTAGDSYVSFGRGLVLSMRKQDELAVDTTLFGGKAVGRIAGFTFTGVGGWVNPVRIDEATGQSLANPAASAADIAAGREGRPVFARDRVYGLRAEYMNRGWGGALHGVRMERPDTLGERFGPRGADAINMAGGSFSAPLPTIGTAYVEGALQQYAGQETEGQGYALYGSLSGAIGRFSGLLELQHYRDFETLAASVDRRRAEAFQFLRYSAPPTTEPVTTDTRFGFFDRCVTGGRARIDSRITDTVLVYGAFGQWATWGERTSLCRDDPETEQRNDVSDGSVGLDLRFDQARSRAIASGGARFDHNHENGSLHYREWRGELKVAKVISGPFSAEVDGRYRRRYWEIENLQQPWDELDLYVSFKWAPWLQVGGGFEYTGQQGRQPTYFNANVLYRYTPESQLKLIAGQQRGALKCVSGVCREFPAFEGVRLEWIQRY